MLGGGHAHSLFSVEILCVSVLGHFCMGKSPERKFEKCLFLKHPKGEREVVKWVKMLKSENKMSLLQPK